MPSALQPFVQTGGKRGFSTFDSADGYGAKRACVGFQLDIENMAPAQGYGSAGGFCAQHAQGYGGAGGFCAQQMPQQLMAQQAFQHAHLQQQQQQQQPLQGGDLAMDCAEMAPESMGMDMDGGHLSRYERFPPKNISGGSPTHYHKSTAIGYIPPLQTEIGMEECTVRTWQCDWQGATDYY